MNYSNLEKMSSFSLENLPDLDEVTLAALELFMKVGIPSLKLENLNKPLVVGSGNAENTAKILFSDKDVILANESNYKEKINSISSIDSAVIISASGGKHAVSISDFTKQKNIPTYLLTCNKNPDAKKFLKEENIIVFPKNKEPYTYNTSTYMSMIIAKTREDPKEIYEFIKEKIDPLIPKNLSDYNAFYVIVPSQFDALKNMINVKFIELFGRVIARDVFTDEQTKHATTVVPANELFIEFGEVSIHPSSNTLKIPLPKEASHAALMAISYYVVGQIQKQNLPYFKENISTYCEKASKVFNQNINPIVS